MRESSAAPVRAPLSSLASARRAAACASPGSAAAPGPRAVAAAPDRRRRPRRRDLGRRGRAERRAPRGAGPTARGGGRSGNDGGRNGRRHGGRAASSGAAGTGGATPAAGGLGAAGTEVARAATAVVIPGAGNCTPPAGANPADAQAAYAKWKTDIVTADGAGGLPARPPPNSSARWSTRPCRRGSPTACCWRSTPTTSRRSTSSGSTAQAHLDGNGLMNWYIGPAGETLGTGAASDADEDMAYALIVADARWGGQRQPDDELHRPRQDADRTDLAVRGRPQPQRRAQARRTGSTARSSTSRTSRRRIYRAFGRVTGADRRTGTASSRRATRDRADAERARTATRQRPRPRLVDARPACRCRRPARAIRSTTSSTRAARRSASPRTTAGTPSRARSRTCRKINGFHRRVGVAAIVDGYDLNGNPAPAVRHQRRPARRLVRRPGGRRRDGDRRDVRDAARSSLRQRRDADAARGQQLLPGVVDGAVAADDDRPDDRAAGRRDRPPYESRSTRPSVRL